ncbi:MAG: VPLPA-CTERM sorting domain-containing protein, partial [Desulfobaccales bacterium]
DITSLNSLSSTLGAESGTATTISSGGAINANSGVLDSSGNRVFTVTSISFPNGTFTITGTSSQYVVLNVSSSDATNGLNGSIALSGGITPDHVLINYYEGGTMTINTNGATTTGVFLDPDGMFTINHSVVDGWVFGGDAENSSIVSGGYVTVPTIPAVPLPPTALLFGTGILGLGMLGWRRKKY